MTSDDGENQKPIIMLAFIRSHFGKRNTFTSQKGTCNIANKYPLKKYCNSFCMLMHAPLFAQVLVLAISGFSQPCLNLHSVVILFPGNFIKIIFIFFIDC